MLMFRALGLPQRESKNCIFQPEELLFLLFVQIQLGISVIRYGLQIFPCLAKFILTLTEYHNMILFFLSSVLLLFSLAVIIIIIITTVFFLFTFFLFSKQKKRTFFAV